MKINIDDWIKKNEDFFKPPVGNLLMHDGQLNVMFVAGPNKRDDFHIQHGEELFFQLKGDMTLKILENNEHKDIVIREGEIFLLPPATPHSPQREPLTMGIVLERERTQREMDVLTFFKEKNGIATTNKLYQVSAHWSQLSTNMKSIFQQFYDSESFKTGNTEREDQYPFALRIGTVSKPMNLMSWIDKNETLLDSKGHVAVFDEDKYAHKIHVCGKGTLNGFYKDAETWILQLKGNSVVTIENEIYELTLNDSVLVNMGKKYQIEQSSGSYVLTCTQECVSWQPTKNKN